MAREMPNFGSFASQQTWRCPISRRRSCRRHRWSIRILSYGAALVRAVTRGNLVGQGWGAFTVRRTKTRPCSMLEIPPASGFVYPRSPIDEQRAALVCNLFHVRYEVNTDCIFPVAFRSKPNSRAEGTTRRIRISHQVPIPLQSGFSPAKRPRRSQPVFALCP